MKPGEHKTVQARILEYAGGIGWTLVSREEAEKRRGFDSEAGPKELNKYILRQHQTGAVEQVVDRVRC